MPHRSAFSRSLPALVAVALLGSCGLDEAGLAGDNVGGVGGSVPGGGTGGLGGSGLTSGSGGIAGAVFGGGTGGTGANGGDAGSGGAPADAADVGVPVGGAGGSAGSDAGDASVDGPTAWKPSDITNCVVWLDAADSTSVAVSGPAVQAWQDKCVGNAVTSSGTAKPSYTPALLNGLPGVRFDGTDDVLEVGGAPKDATAYVLFFVLANYKAVFSPLAVWSNRNFPGPTGGTLTYFGLTNQKVFMFQNAVAPVAFYGATALGAKAHLLELVVGSSGRQLLVDGTIDSTDSAVVATATKLPAGLLGSDKPNNEFAAIDLFEVVFYDRELTATERTTVRTALKAKWALP